MDGSREQLAAIRQAIFMHFGNSLLLAIQTSLLILFRVEVYNSSVALSRFARARSIYGIPIALCIISFPTRSSFRIQYISTGSRIEFRLLFQLPGNIANTILEYRGMPMVGWYLSIMPLNASELSFTSACMIINSSLFRIPCRVDSGTALNRVHVSPFY